MVALVKEPAALRVTNNHVTAARFGQHRSGDFAGKGALFAPGNVLAADEDVRVLRGFGCRRDQSNQSEATRVCRRLLPVIRF